MKIMIFSKLVNCPRCNLKQVLSGVIINLRPLVAKFNCKGCHKDSVETIVRSVDKELRLIEFDKRINYKL